MATSRKLPLSYNESTYNSAGGADYSSLSVWESATDNNLVTATAGEVLTCEAGIHDDSVLLQGAITDADYFRVIRAEAGSEGREDSGVRFVKLWTATNFVIYVDGNAGAGRDNYAGIYDIAIKSYSTTNAVSVHGVFTRDTVGVKVVGCVVYDCTAVGTGYSNGILYARCQDAYIINNFVTNSDGGTSTYNGAIRCVNTSTGADTYFVYNNTITDSDVGLKLERSSTGTCTVLSKNNIIQSNTTNISTSGTVSHTQTTNAEDDGIVFEADGYHLDSDDANTQTYAIDQGTDLSADGNYAFDDDIDGDTRSGTWDIGCDEYVVGRRAAFIKFF